MINIFNYSNYREYLKEYYLDKKKERKGFTYALFSIRAGLRSPNYLKLVSDGKKNLTSSNIIKFANALSLNCDETDYFEALVSFNQSKSTQEREYHLKKLTKLKSIAEIEQSQGEAITLNDWKQYSIMMLASLPYFKNSPEWISKKLYNLVSPSEVVQLLKQLIQDSILVTNEQGQLTTSDQFIKPTTNLQHHEDILTLASRSLKAVDAKELLTTTKYISISTAQLPEIRKKLRDCFAEIGQLALENPRPDRVYSINFSGFPLSTKEEFREDVLWN